MEAMYRPDLDRHFKELKFEAFDGARMRLSHKDLFLAGAEFERKRILEAAWRSGKTELTLEELKKIVDGE